MSEYSIPSPSISAVGSAVATRAKLKIVKSALVNNIVEESEGEWTKGTEGIYSKRCRENVRRIVKTDNALRDPLYFPLPAPNTRATEAYASQINALEERNVFGGAAE